MANVTPPRSSRSATRSLDYIDKGAAHDGTDKPRAWHTTGFGCTPETAADEWRAVRQRFGKDGARTVTDERGTVTEGKYVHAVTVVVSASRDEVDPGDPEAVARWHAQMADTADRLRDGHQVVIGTQTDGKSGLCHTHFTFNAVHPETGKSMNGRHPVKDMQQLKKTVNAVSLEHGFDNEKHMKERARQRPRTPVEEARQRTGAYVWKDDLEARLEAALDRATTRDEWKDRAADAGVEIRFRGKGVSYGFTDADGMDRSIRGRAMGTPWTVATVDKTLAAAHENAARPTHPADAFLARIRATQTPASTPRPAPVDAAAAPDPEQTQARRIRTPEPEHVEPSAHQSTGAARLLARHQPAPAPVVVEPEPEPELPPYTRKAAQQNVRVAHAQVLRKAAAKGRNADGSPRTVWDATHERAEKRYVAAGGRITPAEAMQAEMSRKLKDGRTLGQAAADQAKRLRIPDRDKVTFGDVDARFKQAQKDIAASNAHIRAQRSQGQGQGMSQ